MRVSFNLIWMNLKGPNHKKQFYLFMYFIFSKKTSSVIENRLVIPRACQGGKDLTV